MSIYTDPSTWRLRTTGGVPYKLVEGYPKGSYEEENGKITEQYIIQSGNLQAFVLESFAPMIEWNSNTIFYTPPRGYPGSILFRTKSIAHEPFEQGKPGDPYGIDPTPPLGTYAQFTRLTIDYETSAARDVDPNDPTTFLEISADASGEFLMAPLQGDARWLDANDPVGGGAVVAGLDVPANITIPTVEWSVRWPRVPAVLLDDLVPNMRSHMGTVNSAAMPLLRSPGAETVLFEGYSITEDFTWRNGEVSRAPSTVELKFTEKSINQIANGVATIVGHNHFYRDDAPAGEEKFQRLIFPNGKPAYEQTDLNDMFPPAIGQ